MSVTPPFDGYLYREGVPQDSFDPVDLLRRMGHGRELRRLFDGMDDVFFFVRDRSGLYMAGNTAFLTGLGFHLEEDFIGLSLQDLHPLEIAAAMAEADETVIETGQPSIDLPEILFSLGGNRGLCLTTRLPLPSPRGTCLGIMAFSRRQALGEIDVESASVLDKIALEIRRAPGQEYRIATLAEQCGLTPRRFTERFREVFGTPPLEFILRTRVNAAQESLREGALSIGQIAEVHGFVDQAAFTRHFRRITGMTPGAYRRNDQANES